jgi:hypothetical protein
LISKSKELWEHAPEEEKAKLYEVYTYYNNHRKLVKRYWEVVHPGILKTVPNGEIRGTGTMESNIHNILVERMKRVA